MKGAPASGFDGAQFRALLRAFFILNRRGHLTQAIGRRQQRGGFFMGVFFYVLIGGAIGGGLAAMGVDALTYAGALQFMTLGLTALVVVLESSQILFNPLEEEVLGHLPVGPRTLVAAKIANLMAITLLVGVSLNLVPTFAILKLPATLPWSPLAHAFTVLWVDLFCVAGVVFVYGLVARLVGRERFQALATWAQIFMTVFLMLGSQLVPRLMSRVPVAALGRWNSWLAPLPPEWFAGMESILATGRMTPLTMMTGTLGLIVPPLLAWGALVRLSSMQSRVSGSLAEKAPAPRTAAARAGRPVATLRLNAPLRGWLSDPVERATFRLVACYMRRDRHLMQQLYPQLAFLFIYPLIMVFSTHQGGPVRGGAGGSHPASMGADAGLMFLGFGLWMLAMMPLSALQLLEHSEHCAAAELFTVAPLERPGGLFHGARKAVLYYLALPCAAVILTIFALISRSPSGDLLLGLPMILAIPTITLLPALGGAWLPLAQPPVVGRQPGRVALTFGTMLLALIVMGASYGAHRLGLLWLLLLAEVPLIVIVHRTMLRTINRRVPLQINDRRNQD